MRVADFSSDGNLEVKRQQFKKKEKPKRQTSLANIKTFPRIFHVILLSRNYLQQIKYVKKKIKKINEIVILRKLKSIVSLTRFNLSMVEHKYYTNLRGNLKTSVLYLILNLP